jgi:hypothetical protein
VATVHADRILTRLRELLQDGLGTIRTIANTRFAGDLPPGLDAREERRRGIVDEKPIDITLSTQRPHPNRITTAGNVQLWYVDATIRIVRTLDLEAQVSDTARDAIEALKTIDGGMIADVLEWPINLALTNAGDATGMKGARYKGGSVQTRGEAGEAMDIVTTHQVEITVMTSPATS